MLLNKQLCSIVVYICNREGRDMASAAMEELEKQLVDKAKAEAEAAKGKEKNDDSIAFTHFRILLSTYSNPLQLFEIHNWAGSDFSPYTFPDLFPTNTESWVFHKGPLPAGSKAGLAYADHVRGLNWIMAFDNPRDKVFITSEPIGKVNWEEIEASLNVSENKCYYEHPERGRMVAQILSGWTSAVVGLADYA